jgi:hypothetical protein
MGETGERFWRNRGAIAAAVFVVAAGYLLWSEHRPHVLGILPYVLLLACPLMHVFMHGGHGGHGHGGHRDADRPDKRQGEGPRS